MRGRHKQHLLYDCGVYPWRKTGSSLKTWLIIINCYNFNDLLTCRLPRRLFKSKTHGVANLRQKRRLSRSKYTLCSRLYICVYLYFSCRLCTGRPLLLQCACPGCLKWQTLCARHMHVGGSRPEAALSRVSVMGHAPLDRVIGVRISVCMESWPMIYQSRIY